MAKKSPLIKPYLKWAGGKRQLLPEIRNYFPERIDKYYEPFLGAGAVLFDLQPKKAVVNDFNSQLILTYSVIKHHVDELIEALRTHHKNNSEEYYYEVRAQDRDPVEFERLSEIEKAARLMAKFDQSAQLPEVFNLSILPITRGEYLIGPFQTHEKISYPHVKPTPVEIPELQTLDYTNLLLFAYNSSIIQDIMGSDKVAFTVNGRMSSGSFDYYINNSEPVLT